MTTKAPTQISFALTEFECKKKITRREVFLAKMEQVVPWSRLMEVIEPYYPKSGKRGRTHPLTWRKCCACTSYNSGTA